MTALIAWFLVYGVYYGLSEGTEKALVADLAPAALRGTAFGIYNAALGVGSLLASVVFGLVWKLVGPGRRVRTRRRARAARDRRCSPFVVKRT